MSKDPVAEFREVTKRYPAGLMRRRALTAVEGVSLRIHRGEVVGLLGPNRAGKTTLVKVLLSLCRPSSGRAARFGRPVEDRDTLRRVGYVRENPAFPRYLTAAQLLEFYGSLSGVPRDELRASIPRLLDTVGLADRAREPIGRFSKGMVQRLGIAQALVNAPDLLVLDEPNEGLDLSGRQLVGDLVLEGARAGRSVLLITHVLPDVERLCDRVAVLRGGRLVYDGTPADLTRGPDGPRTLERALQGLYEAPAR